ncbi:MAG: hypothetical protein KBS51_01790 [Lachnospiraceae bacterium]|nr:hypothetical protein [Candidatus Darwinimomas equi]
MSTAWTIVLIVLCVIAAVLVILYFVGRKMQNRQAEQQAIMDQQKMTVSMLIIDKKKMKIKDANMPKQVEEQLPLYAKFMKFPIVKAKVGPKILTLMAEPQVFEILPVKTECKVVVSGIYITEIKSVRGQAVPKAPVKKGLITKLRDKVKK